MHIFPNIEQSVRLLLRGFTDAPVSVNVPRPRPAEFVTVQRIGGSSSVRILDEPVVMIECWGESVSAVGDLTGVLRAALMYDYMSIPGVMGVDEVTGPYYAPDPDSKQPRYRFSVRLFVRPVDSGFDGS